VPDEGLIDAESAPDVVHAALSSFMALPLSQRAAVILKDVLELSLEEIADSLRSTVPAVKSLLVRGRARLRLLEQEDPIPWRDRPETPPGDRLLLSRYANLFNSRDWDGLRALLTDDSRLELVGMTSRQGKRIGEYFDRYARDPEIQLEVARIEGRDGLLALRPPSRSPAHIILIDWSAARIGLIRDYRYVPHVVQELSFQPLAPETT